MLHQQNLMCLCIAICIAKHVKHVCGCAQVCPSLRLQCMTLQVTMGINYFGAFYLTHLLLGKLLQQPRSRVIFENSVSEVHGELHWDDLTHVPQPSNPSLNGSECCRLRQIPSTWMITCTPPSLASIAPHDISQCSACPLGAWIKSSPHCQTCTAPKVRLSKRTDCIHFSCHVHCPSAQVLTGRERTIFQVPNSKPVEM